MTATVQLLVESRWSRDTVALADRLERIFREHTVGADGVLDSVSVSPQKRGGSIQFWATVGGDRAGLVDRVRAIGDAIDTNANLIDRIDQYRTAAHSEMKVVAFRQSDYRGFYRELAIDELTAATS